jgi:hypothetical protein
MVTVPQTNNGTRHQKVSLKIFTMNCHIIGVGRGVGGCERPPLWKKIFEIDREIPLTRIFFKIDSENMEFLTKRPPSANPGYAYAHHLGLTFFYPILVFQQSLFLLQEATDLVHRCQVSTDQSAHQYESMSSGDEASGLF